MFNKPIKTYLRKPEKLSSRPPLIPTVQLFSDSDDASESVKNEDLEDTFDKLRKSARPIKPLSPSSTVDALFLDTSNDSELSELEEIPLPESLWKASPKRGRKRKTKLEKKENTEKIKKLSNPKEKKGKTTKKNIKPTDSTVATKKNTIKTVKLKKINLPIEISSEDEEERADGKKNKHTTDELRECHVRLSQLNLKKAQIKQKNALNKVKKYRSSRDKSKEKAIDGNASVPDNYDDFVKTVMLESMKKLDEEYLADVALEKSREDSPWSVESINQSLVDEFRAESQKKSAVSINESIQSDSINKSIQSDSINESIQSDSINKSIQSDSINESIQSDSISKSIQSDSINKSIQSDSMNQSHSSNENKGEAPIASTKESSAEVVTKDCSVLLSRLIRNPEGSKRAVPSINRSLLCSTPLVSRLGVKGTKLQLSPIERKSLTINKEDSARNSRSSDARGENGQLNLEGSTVIINFSQKNSISVIDEDTELVSSLQGSSTVEDTVKNSLKERIERELFSSKNNQSESIEIIENPELSNKENNSNNQIIGEDNRLINPNPLSLSVRSVSPLLFEDTEVEVGNEEEEEGAEGVGMNNLTVDVSSGMSRSMSPLLFDDNDEDARESRDSIDVCADKNESIDPTLSEKINVPEIKLPDVVLMRLSDPTRVNDRRDRYKIRDNPLSAISENADGMGAVVEENETGDSGGNLALVEEEERAEDDDKVGDNRVFLKPGKSYARSLSILNQIKNKNDFEALSVGKGENWRKSVLSLLEMQNQGVVQSCVGRNENDKDQLPPGRLSGENVSTKWLSLDRRTIASSPGRFIRRVSIRVVPDNKSIKHVDKPVQDPSFLEAYGITTSKDRQTLVKKSITPPRKTNYNFRNSTNIPKIHDPIAVARNVVLERCNQADSRPFSHVYGSNYLEKCRKIGEGVYGEVFLFDDGKEKSVIKIIPIEGNELVNGEPQKKFNEILSEIIIAKELHDLRVNETYRTDGFVEVKSIRCLNGKYPKKLVELWEKYDEEKRSENDCPSMFNEEQLYIALELGDGGKDLEGFVFQNASEAHSSFIQTALTLAVAERSLDFEHRDLHWGNILISRTNQTEISYKLDNEEVSFPCRGVKVSIIDFTLSRMSYQGCCIFNDLALDPSLFTAQGEYQFEIYRLMRAKVGNEWQRFEPYTNILWLHYTLDKMISAVRYNRKGTKIHKNYLSKMEELKNLVLDYDSAFDFVHNCENIRELLNIIS